MITVNLFEIILAALSCLLVKLWWTHRKFFHLAAKIPLVDGGLPLIGIAHKFIGAGNKGVISLRETSLLIIVFINLCFRIV